MARSTVTIDQTLAELVSATPYEVHGTVKWFDARKGFGFVIPNGGGEDILLHMNVLQDYGQSSVPDGSPIRILVATTPGGLQATEVLLIEPLIDTVTTLPDFRHLTDADIEALEIEPARVKWYSVDQGYGFANVFGSEEDIYLEADVLCASGLKDLPTGEAIALRVIELPGRKVAVEVISWFDIEDE